MPVVAGLMQLLLRINLSFLAAMTAASRQFLSPFGHVPQRQRVSGDYHLRQLVRKTLASLAPGIDHQFPLPPAGSSIMRRKYQRMSRRWQESGSVRAGGLPVQVKDLTIASAAGQSYGVAIVRPHNQQIVHFAFLHAC